VRRFRPVLNEGDLLARALWAVRGSRAWRQEVTFVVCDDTPVELDGVSLAFDDERAVADAGVTCGCVMRGDSRWCWC
jgi:hypothetical protein